MPPKENAIILKRKKGGEGHGAHGGSWKVAYADFVTAMMCFFLVMWLLGSDDETKAAVAHYFIHPNTPWKAGADPYSVSQHPMGESEGSGETILFGTSGLWPQDLIDRPLPHRTVMEEARTISMMIEDLLEGKIYGMDVSQERVKFSLPDHVLFSPNSNKLLPEATKYLDLLGQVLKQFKGFIMIEGHTDEPSQPNTSSISKFRLSFDRALSVMDYLVQKHKLNEKNIIPQGSGARHRFIASNNPEDRKKNHRVEFTLSYNQPES